MTQISVEQTELAPVQPISFTRLSQALLKRTAVDQFPEIKRTVDIF